jgi:NAD(P)-dependent dehydrogenase (short-subunit alcohol dehydrogenase family)
MKGRIIVVTGAAGGFGRKIVHHFKKDSTVIACVRKEEDMNSLYREGAAAVYRMDITVKDDRHAVMEKIAEDYSRIDILINNAGMCQGGVQEALGDTDWEHQLNVNVTGTASVTRLALPMLKKSSAAKIIQMGSVSGRIGLPGVGAYAASKFALRGMSQSLRFELLPLSIHVTLLEIASFKTAIWDKSRDTASYYDGEDYEELEKYLKEKAEQTSIKAADPKVVIKTIGRISDMKKPAFLYRVGAGAGIYALLDKWLPMRMLEKIVVNKTGGKSG